MRFPAAILLALFATTAVAQSSSSSGGTFEELANNFGYPNDPFQYQQLDVSKRGKALVIDFTFAGAENSTVPAYLVVPEGDGPFPVILWGHWMKKGSPLANREEFLNEALALAQSGAMSLMIDAPMVRHNFQPETEPLRMAEQSSYACRQEVIDFRRALDYLLSRRSVDAKHIAYVGHSFGAHVGAILAAVEHRIGYFVLMAGSYSDQENTMTSTDPQVVAYRKQVGDAELKNYFTKFAWDDPKNFVGHTDDKSIFLQFASQDPTTPQRAQQYLEMFSAKDKKLQFYNASHALNAAARLDRDRWLQEHLKFKKIDEQELAKIPELR